METLAQACSALAGVRAKGIRQAQGWRLGMGFARARMEAKSE